MRIKSRLYLSLVDVLPQKSMGKITLTIEGTELELIPSVKLLGLEIDSEHLFTSHADKLCTKVS